MLRTVSPRLILLRRLMPFMEIKRQDNTDYPQYQPVLKRPHLVSTCTPVSPYQRLVTQDGLMTHVAVATIGEFGTVGNASRFPLSR